MTESEPDHLGVAALAAFLEGTLDVERRSAASDHLAHCSRCRNALTDASATLLTRTRPRVRLTAVTSVAIAAGLAAIFIVPVMRNADLATVAPIRGEQSGGVATFATVEPPEGATVSLDRLRFAWAPAGADARYQITVTNDVGDVVWTAPTRETSIDGTASNAFDPGAVYYWYVDALLDGGQAARTAVMEFRTQP